MKKFFDPHEPLSVMGLRKTTEKSMVTMPNMRPMLEVPSAAAAKTLKKVL